MLQTEEYLQELNDQQKAAVEYCDGPSLVIAGAGSGKTRVLTYKIVHLLGLGVEPYRILALTFTNKAAREMRERIEHLTGPKLASRLWMGTFHSIFSKILRINSESIGFRHNYTIYDTADSKSVIKAIIKDMDLDDKVYKPSTVQNHISWAKNNLISPDQYLASRDLMEADRRSRRPHMGELYRAYCQRCFVAGAMDFDDLLLYTHRLLNDNPDILRHYQEYFRYILVDEYQDTNFAQHVIISQLAKSHKHICVVGDDAQSIYSFRGANISNILNLKKEYPGLSLFKLERNYRSTQTIINAANTLIEKNRNQIPKNVFSRNDVGQRIEVAQCYSDLEEATSVVNRLRRLKRETGDSYEEFAILYRTNAQSRTLEEQLRKANVPYRIYGGLSFYQRKEIKDAVAYLRLTVNPDDDEALKRVINFPARGIGETTVNKVQRAAIDGGVSMWQVLTDRTTYGPIVNAGTWRKLDMFVTLIKRFTEANTEGRDAYEITKMVMRDTGILSMLVSDSTPENITRRENLEELVNGVNEFVESSLETGQPVTLADFLGQISLATDQDQSDGNNEAVTLMTVHAAKGLEFTNVFIVGVEDDLFPSSMSKDSPAQLEEERRLLYVAVTRAKTFCMMSYAKSRFRNGMTMPTRPSPFLRDIDRQYLNFVSGKALGRGPASVDPVANYRASFHTPTRVSPEWGSHGDSARGRQPEAAVTPKPLRTNAPASDYALHSSVELTVGDVIEHARFGRGTVTEINTDTDDHRIIVEFDTSDIKTLLLKYARFKILS